MRDTKKIYENAMLEVCFNKLKSFRNSWTYEKNDKFGLATIIDICGDDYLSYDSIMKHTENIIFDMIPNICRSLMDEYGIHTKWYQFREKEARVYSIDEVNNWPEYVEHINCNYSYAFSYKNLDNENVLYIFKKFGLNNRFPKSLIKTMIENEAIDKHYYVSFVESDAYSEIINYNQDSNDITKGTGLYSLKQFFDMFFDSSEYNLFKTYSNILADKVKDYYGFQIVRTLTPNSFHYYNKVVRDSLLNFDIDNVGFKNRLSKTQRDIIKSNFITRTNYEVLIGTSVFAQSFMTAEWLFYSLQNAENIDLTSIAMGYFKSIEQFLFSYISLHTLEKDSVKRKIFAGAKPLDTLSDKLLNDSSKVKNINLKSITSFFGDFNSQKFYPRNMDLLADGIDDETYYYIVESLSTFVGLRNGYFHKHNLNDWTTIEETRNHALLIFYLVLGGYRISEQDKLDLGLIKTVESGYLNLCEYIHNRKNDNMLEIPIFYFGRDRNEFDFYFSNEDPLITYDSNLEPIYSGVYFRRPGNSKSLFKLTDSNIPEEIWEGKLIIGRQGPSFKPSGPLVKIFEDGKFFKIE